LAGPDDTMEFRLLGPFQASERGRPLEVGVGKQRALLALLLLRAGEVVSTYRLIDALWDEDPPASALNSVHVYVSNLRKALGSGRLETRGHGYMLALESEQLDLGRFERLLGEGRKCLAKGEADRAADALRAALALWGGPPLSDFASEPFAQGEIARLEELHSAALEERIEADLALGRHAELISELEALIHEHPLRERLRAQLMLALYRSGRQAEALAAYQQARKMLAEKLGLKPGRSLQELERAILRQDAELDPPGQASTLVAARRRSGILIAIGAVLLLSTAIAVAAIELTGGDSPGLSSASANSVAAIDANSNRLVAEVPVGDGPTSVAVGEGSVWVTNALDRTISRIDPRTSDVIQRIDVGGDPSGIAIGAGAIWVANSSDGTVSRIDPETNHEVDRITVGVTPTAVAYGAGAVWVTSAEERSVTKIVHGRLVDRIPTGALGRGIAAGGGSVWVTDESSRRVVRIDARRDKVIDTVSVGNGPTGITFGHGSVWVANSLDGTVSRIDPETNTVTATIAVGDGPDGIAVGPGVVWVSSEFSEEIARIDPAENEVVETTSVANRPKGLALLENRVWFAVQPSGSGHRGGRLVVEAHELIDGSIDPTFWTWAGTGDSLSSTTYDGLVGFARRGGSEGTQIVPNLAERLPVITNGETRYAFQLRRGIHYSNGMPVKASDFRRAVERGFQAGRAGDAPLVGADACKRRPRSCDLSRVIQTDDATGTIVFQLVRPAAQFLQDLAAFLVPIPRGTPDRDQGTRPVPSTGPYMIESYVPGRALTFVRNPYFHVRSQAARPDGFPDEIEFRLSGPAGVTAVERGRADVGFASDQPESIRMLEDFKLRHPSQVHAQVVQATVGVFLNTTKPPFDDVRVRRAVNYAVDRAAISASFGGPEFAQVTCQPRPPGTVGFRRFCPYTAATSQTGEWKAPDLMRARRLVAASGTRGLSVTVWTYPGFWEPAAKGAVRALKELGYRASVRRVETLNAYIAKVGNEKTRGVQAGVFGWWNVPRTASSLLASFSCSPPDWSFFCDRRIDTRIARALTIGATDPDAAVALWAGIERKIVDLAPWVPLFTPFSASFTSKRVGNYQDNPELGILFDQLWVR
jgi:peptide/nickel transport system substrate-binding protein